MSFPCDTCLIKPRCKYKDYSKLFDDCEHITRLMYKHKQSDSRYRKDNFRENIQKLYSILKPVNWTYQIDGERITVVGNQMLFTSYDVI